MDFSAKFVEFAFRNAAGKFLKDLKGHQFQNVSISRDGIVFDAVGLEVNTETVNNEVLCGTGVRLGSAFINEVHGDLAYRSSKMRSVTVDGLDVTLEFTGSVSSGAGPRDSGQGAAAGTNLLSSMVDDDDDDVRPPSPSEGTPDIDQSASSLSALVRNLVHNTTATVTNVTVRLRFPPPKTWVGEGQPMPAGSVELLVHIPTITLADDTDLHHAVNNSFTKALRFSGVIVQLYDCGASAFRRHATRMNQELSLEHTIMQGDPIDLDAGEQQVAANCPNLVRITFTDDEARPAWSCEPSLTQLHVVLSPAQFLRVLRIGDYFARAPTRAGEQDPTGRMRGDVAVGSFVKVVLSEVSVALLRDDDTPFIAGLWGDFNRSHIPLEQGLARTPHYAIRLRDLRIMAESPAVQSSHVRDGGGGAAGDAWRAIGGSFVAVRVLSATVTERRCNAPPAELLQLRGPAEDGGPGLGASVRTSYAVDPHAAKVYGIDVDAAVAHYAQANGVHVEAVRVREPYVVQQLLEGFVLAPLDITVDVEILGRVLQFVRSITVLADLAAKPHPFEELPHAALFETDGTVASAVDSTMFYSAQSTLSDTDGGELGLGSLNVAALRRLPTVEDLEEAEASDPAAAAAALASAARLNAARRAALRSQLYVVSAHASVTLRKTVSLRLKFPTTRRPREDIWGPATLRLFDTLAAAVPPSAVPGAPSFLPRTLLLRLSDARLVLPTGTTDVVDVQAARTDLILEHDGDVDAHGRPSRTKLLSFTEPALQLQQRAPASVTPPDLDRLRADMTGPGAADAEAAACQQAATFVKLVLPEITTTAVRQDDFLIIFAMAVDLGDCVSGALQKFAAAFVPSDSHPADLFASGTSLPDVALSPTTAVRIEIGNVDATLQCARLGPNGLPVSEPLWSLLPPDVRGDTDPQLLYHTFKVLARGVDVMLAMQSPTPRSTSMACAVRCADAQLAELLPVPRWWVKDNGDAADAVPWGESRSLVRGYANLFERSNNLKPPSRDEAGGPSRVLEVYVRRLFDMDAKTDGMDLDVVLNRIAVTHHAAHDGDHWPSVLSQMFVDAPDAVAAPPEAADGGDDENDDTYSIKSELQPFAARTSVELTLRDILLEYTPAGAMPKAVVIAPELSFSTGDLRSGETAATLGLTFRRAVRILVHDAFPAGLLDYDAALGDSSAFGGSRVGLEADLSALGFVRVGSVGGRGQPSPVSASPVPDGSTFFARAEPEGDGPVHVRVLLDQFKDRPVVVHATKLLARLELPSDTAVMLQQMAAAMGTDARHHPTPAEYVHYSRRSHKNVPLQGEAADDARGRQRGPLFESFVSDAEKAIAEALERQFRETAPVPSPGRMRPVESDLSDFELLDHADATPDAVVREIVWSAPGGGADPLGGRSLVDLCRDTKHFSRTNPVFNKRRTDVPARELPRDAPAVSVELVVHDCDVEVALVGGSDFATTMPYEDMGQDETEGFDTLQTEFRVSIRPDGSRRHISLRNTDCVVARLKDVAAQLDVFQAGGGSSLLLHVQVADVEVEDLVAESPVRHMLSCRLPVEHRDRAVLELKWQSLLPAVPVGPTADQPSVPRGEEQLSFRVLPLQVSCAESTVELLAQFGQSFAAAQASDGEPDAASGENRELFFNRLQLHPLELRFSWYPSAFKDVSRLLQRDFLPLLYVCSMEDASVDLAGVVIRRCAVSQLADELLEAYGPQLFSSNAVLLLAGLQPFHSAAEVSGAVTELALTPLEYFRHNKSVAAGIARGMRGCVTRLGGESLRLIGSTSNATHSLVHRASANRVAAGYVDPLQRGDQPDGFHDGVSRGARSVGRGVVAMGNAMRFAVADGATDASKLVWLPLSALLPVEGVLRGVTEVFLGSRNELQPDARRRDVERFKR